MLFPWLSRNEHHYWKEITSADIKQHILNELYCFPHSKDESPRLNPAMTCKTLLFFQQSNPNTSTHSQNKQKEEKEFTSINILGMEWQRFFFMVLYSVVMALPIRAMHAPFESPFIIQHSTKSTIRSLMIMKNDKAVMGHVFRRGRWCKWWVCRLVYTVYTVYTEQLT